MEFDHVYVIGLAEGVLPSWQSAKEGDQSPSPREERRNCFVAISRTQTSLTLTYALRYNGSKDPSRFLAEMGLTEGHIGAGRVPVLRDETKAKIIPLAEQHEIEQHGKVVSRHGKPKGQAVAERGLFD